MTDTDAAQAYYDPFDFTVDDDPYPVWKRLRDEAPLYYNEQHGFYALSRFGDVSREMPNWETFQSGRGTVLDILMNGIEVPPGIILFEDPPQHDVHRRLLSRVFTPKRMAAVESKAREFCSRTLEPLVGTRGFDFHRRSGCVDADADHRLPPRHPPAGPGGHPAEQRGLPQPAGRHARRGRSGHLREQLSGVLRLHRPASRSSVRRSDDRPVERRVRG